MSEHQNIAGMLFCRPGTLCLAFFLMLSNCAGSSGQSPYESATVVLSIDENSPGGKEVGALAELYPELSNFRFSQRSRSTLFQLNPDTGVFSVREGAKLDFEKRPFVSLTIVADIREEQEDPYLIEFAESLREEGLSTRTLTRLIPREQRIQIQVVLRDLEEAEEAVEVAPNENETNDEHVPADNSETSQSKDRFVEEPGNADPESMKSTAFGESPSQIIDAKKELITEELSEKETTVSKILSADSVVRPTERVSAENVPPAHHSDSPRQATLEVAAEETVVSASDDVDTAGVPLPADVPSVPQGNPETLDQKMTLSDSSGQPQFQLNAASSENAQGPVSTTNTAGKADPTVTTTENSKEVSAATPTTILVKMLVSLTIILSAAYLFRHRWKSLRSSLARRPDETVTEDAASVETVVVVDESVVADDAEQKAADEFVKEPVQEEELPHQEHAIKSAIAGNSDDDPCAPFDPESLIDDEYFSESDSLQQLRAINAEIGEQLAARISSDESNVADPLELVERLAVTASPVRPALTEPKDERSRAVERDLDDIGDEFVGEYGRDFRSEYIEDRSASSRYDHDPSSPAEPRWNSDWPGYSEENAAPSTVVLTEAVAERSSEEKRAELSESTDEKIAHLRNELADLFAMQKKSEIPEPVSVASVETVESEVKEATETNEAIEKQEPCPEETHLESVAQYLSQLLERSKKDEATDAVFVDRRKSGDKPSGKWDGIDRRNSQKPKAPVKSFIESYMSEHGGELANESTSSGTAIEPGGEQNAAADARAPVVRQPVDVQAIRQHMISFRHVATTALEHALASHRIRQAKGKMAWRTTLIAGLIVVSVLAVATNSAMKIYFPSLGWLMGIIVCLAIAELVLRIEAIRRHRRELRYRILEPSKKVGDRADKGFSESPDAVD